MNGKILLFQLPPLLEKRLSQVAQAMQLQLRPVKRCEYGRTIGQIAMLPPAAGEDGLALEEAMMVLCVRSERLDDVLAALRQAGAQGICKAVLTQTNAAWTPPQLLEQLQRERAQLHKMP